MSNVEEVVQYIKSEHQRWRNIVGPEQRHYYIGQYTIGIHEVLDAHFLLAEYFARTGEGLGGLGPKNLDLLHSALARQHVEYNGIPKWSNRIEICASLTYGLIKNHAFHDANKRTAFLISILHLQKIGRVPNVPGQEFEDFMVQIADNRVEEYRFYGSTTGHKSDREVSAIAIFLKKSSRDIDLSMKQITYNQLNQILRHYGLQLDKPKGNRIDVVRFRSLDNDQPLAELKRIAHIGFHGWTKQVSRKDIHIVRSAAQLDAKHGYDSQAFFNGLASPLMLIERYREPLRRLAFR